MGRTCRTLAPPLAQLLKVLAGVLMGALLAASLLVAGAVPAGAQGSLSQFLVSNPGNGFSAVTPAQDQTLTQSLENAEKGGFNQPFTVGAAEYTNGSSQLIFGITVLQSAAAFDSTTAVASACESATQTSASSTSPVSGISGSAIGTCSGTEGGNQVVEAFWEQANVIAFVEAVGVSEDLVAGQALAEAALIPSGGIPLSSITTTTAGSTGTSTPTPTTAASSSSSSSTLDGVIGGVVILVIIALVVIVFVQRSRRRKGSAAATGAGAMSQPPPYVAPGQYQTSVSQFRPPNPPPTDDQQAPINPFPDPGEGWDQPVEDAPVATGYPADWYPVEGNPHLMRYWDGSSWSGQRRWNGGAWVDEPVG